VSSPTTFRLSCPELIIRRDRGGDLRHLSIPEVTSQHLLPSSATALVPHSYRQLAENAENGQDAEGNDEPAQAGHNESDPGHGDECERLNAPSVRVLWHCEHRLLNSGGREAEARIGG